MRACVLLCALVGARGLSLHLTEPEQPYSDEQFPLEPMVISCGLSDIIIISAPVIHDALYYLTNPRGSTIPLNITRPTYTFDPNKPLNSEYDSIVVKHARSIKTIAPAVKYKIFDLLPDSYEDITLFEEQTKDLKANDFLIGPLLEDDHGNWMLSVYYERNQHVIEMYQVITIEITDYVPPKPRLPEYKAGETFKFSFAYAIPFLESCELHAPRTSFDRFYDRDMTVNMDRCGYVIKNLTTEDRGLWSITGVGRIVYKTQVSLEVIDDPASEIDTTEKH